MTLRDIEQPLAQHGLAVMGMAYPDQGDVKSVVLIGADAGLWSAFAASSEFRDRDSNPLDRWSKRIIRELAAKTDATAVFPSDGPPYPPFIAWALASGRFWQSPVGMMVHDHAGLMISLRGALLYTREIQSIADMAGQRPCDSCSDQPCRTACPVNALGGADGYDVAACRAYLDTGPGDACMTEGCAARRACPVSLSFGRPSQQSAFHMQSFHPK